MSRQLNLTDDLTQFDPEQAIVLIPHHLHKACFVTLYNRVISEDVTMTGIRKDFNTNF